MRNVGWPLPKGKREEARKKGILEQAETLELVLVDVVTFFRWTEESEVRQVWGVSRLWWSLWDKSCELVVVSSGSGLVWSGLVRCVVKFSQKHSSVIWRKESALIEQMRV